MQKKTTLRSLALHLGISLGTVSRALANDPLIAQKTRSRVHAAAELLNYRPNRAAQSLRTGRTGTVILIVDFNQEVLSFSTSIIGGITSALTEANYQLLVIPASKHQDTELIKQIVRDQIADGIIIPRTEPHDARARYLSEVGFPFVTHGRTELDTVHPFVDYDNEAFALVATEAVIAAGARKPAILLPDRRFTFAKHLYKGYLDAVSAASIAETIVPDVGVHSRSVSIGQSISYMLRMAERPDGFILPGENSALAAMAAIYDANLQPCVDVHIAAKQTSQVFSYIRPRITTVFEDVTEAGEMLAKFLLRSIAGEGPEHLNHVQPVQLPLVIGSGGT